MDQDRQIRYLIPPFFLFGSLLLGAYFGNPALLTWLQPDNAKEALGLLSATVVIVLPLGFLLNTTIVVAGYFVGLVTRRSYEAWISDAAFGNMWRQIRSDDVPSKRRSRMLLVSATFDHELLSKGVHLWVMRRWNAFNVCASSALGIATSHYVAGWFNIPGSPQWRNASVAVGGALSLVAIVAWWHTMRMLEFQAERPQVRTESRESEGN